LDLRRWRFFQRADGTNQSLLMPFYSSQARNIFLSRTGEKE